MQLFQDIARPTDINFDCPYMYTDACIPSYIK